MVGPLPSRDWLVSRIEATPLLELTRAHTAAGPRIWAQCELFAPTGSHKDRMYLHIIRDLEARGDIHPGMILIDYSSGNGGAALAFVAGMLGYEAIVVRPAEMTVGKAAQITAFGARLVETPAVQGVEGAIQGARELAALLGSSCFLINQGYLEANAAAYLALGNHMVAQFTAVGIAPQVFVCSIGTGGTFAGLARAFKSVWPDIKCIAVDVEGQTMLSHSLGGHALSSRGHGVEGISIGKLFGQVHEDAVDGFVVVSEEEAMEASRLLWLETRILAGFSSGANLAAIAKLRADSAVTVLFDSLWKYFHDERTCARPLRDRRSTLSQTRDLVALARKTAPDPLAWAMPPVCHNGEAKIVDAGHPAARTPVPV